MRSPERFASVTIPQGLDFSDLRLSRDSIGTLRFNWQPLELICLASGMELPDADDPEDVQALIVYWYVDHLNNGGGFNHVADDLKLLFISSRLPAFKIAA